MWSERRLFLKWLIKLFMLGNHSTQATLYFIKLLADTNFKNLYSTLRLGEIFSKNMIIFYSFSPWKKCYSPKTTSGLFNDSQLFQWYAIFLEILLKLILASLGLTT